MNDDGLVIGIVMGMIAAFVMMIVFVEVNREVISNDILDDVCKNLARDERAEYKNAGLYNEGQKFRCVIPKTIPEPVTEGVIVIER